MPKKTYFSSEDFLVNLGNMNFSTVEMLSSRTIEKTLEHFYQIDDSHQDKQSLRPKPSDKRCTESYFWERQ